MNKKVIEYFDTYFSNFGGELNESTSNEQLEEAALDLVNLTEEVLHFTENVFVRAAQLEKAKKMKQGLKRSRFPFTKAQRQRNVDRKVLSQTRAGRQTLRKVDDPEFIKSKEQSLRTAVEKNPDATKPSLVPPKSGIGPPAKKASELQKGTEYGSKKAKEIAQTQHKDGQAVHSGMRQVAGKNPNVTDTGLLPGKSQAPKDPKKYSRIKKTAKVAGKAAKYAAAGLGGLALAGAAAVGLGHLSDDVNHDEEEKNNPYQDHEKMRISQRLINLKRGENWESRAKRSKKERRAARSGDKKYIKDIVTNIAVDNAVAKQPHAQKSLVVADDGEGKSITDQGRGQTTAVSNIKAMMDADGISDSLRSGIKNLKKNVATGKTKPKIGEYQANALLDMAKREKKKELRRGQEARGQGRLFPTKTRKGSEAKK